MQTQQQAIYSFFIAEIDVANKTIVQYMPLSGGTNFGAFVIPVADQYLVVNFTWYTRPGDIPKQGKTFIANTNSTFVSVPPGTLSYSNLGVTGSVEVNGKTYEINAPIVSPGSKSDVVINLPIFKDFTKVHMTGNSLNN